MEAGTQSVRRPASRVPAWVLGLIPLVLIVVAIGSFAVARRARAWASATGPPVEELAVEQTVLKPGVIELTVRNDGPDPVRIAQVIVNDAFASFAGRRRRDRPARHRDAARSSSRGSRARPTTVALLTSTGATIDARDPRGGRDARPPTPASSR